MTIEEESNQTTGALYPKKLMSTPELIKLGFSRTYLERAYRSNKNNFASKITPGKTRSKIIYDTDKFEAWRQKEIAMQRGRNRPC